MKYAGLRVTVMGLGLFGGGSEVARWLARAGALVTVTDTAGEDRLAKSLKSLAAEPIHRYVLGGHREEDFREADLVVVNPAVHPANMWLAIAESSGAKLTSEMELFLENCPARVIAVTGSNGKSTTTAMIASILKADGRRVFLGGNLGGSLLGELGTIGRYDWVALELSSFQLHRLGKGVSMPETAVITNFSPNHLNWHPDPEHYAAAKQRLLVSQPSHGTAVFDPESPGLAGWQRLVRGSLVVPETCAQWPTPSVCGRHNQTNASLAAATARCVGCEDKAIETGIHGFRGLPDRLQPVAAVGGRQFFNDSASTTPESTIAALETLQEPIWLLAGGADKGIGYERLLESITERAAGAVFFGQVAKQLAEILSSRSNNPVCFAVESLEEAFSVCVEKSTTDATIVLSPACSSHDQFANYCERGKAFVKLVASYRDNHAP